MLSQATRIVQDGKSPFRRHPFRLIPPEALKPVEEANEFNLQDEQHELGDRWRGVGRFRELRRR